MINYTKGKWGAIVFPRKITLAQLKLNNCCVVKGDKSIWVFPFGKILKYLEHYRYYNDDRFEYFLEGKKESMFILKGEIIRKDFHFSCIYKHNYITGNCAWWNCKYQPLPDTPFNWNRENLRYVEPLYCDTEHKACRSVFFTQLCPDEETIKANKKTLSRRGKRAGFTRSIKEKCAEYIYKEVCADKYNHTKNACRVTRKMANRKMRELARERFGNYKHLLELMKYVGKEDKHFEIICPYKKNKMIVRTENNYQTDYARLVFSDIKDKITPNKITDNLEKEAKAFLFLLSILEEENSEVLSLKVSDKKILKAYFLYQIGNYLRYELEKKTYQDIIREVKKRKKKEIFGK